MRLTDFIIHVDIDDDIPVKMQDRMLEAVDELKVQEVVAKCVRSKLAQQRILNGNTKVTVEI